MNSTYKNRKLFSFGLSFIATAITLASAGASYSINLQSFSDWPQMLARIFAILATLGVECTFALLLYGISNALSGVLEKSIAVLGLVSIVCIMAMNFTVHRQIVTGASLSEWETAWASYAGSAVLFGILGLVVCLSMASHEAAERRLQRDIEYISKRKALEWKKEALESSALSQFLNSSRSAVYAEVQQQLQLPNEATFPCQTNSAVQLSAAETSKAH